MLATSKIWFSQSYIVGGKISERGKLLTTEYKHLIFSCYWLNNSVQKESACWRLSDLFSLFRLVTFNISSFLVFPPPQFIHESRLSEAYSQQRQARRQAHKRWHAEVSSDVVSIKFHFVFLNWNERKGCQCSMTHLFSTRLSIVNHD